MNRLLFAAARGARVHVNGFISQSTQWYDNIKWSTMHESVLRIHPDDEHLQYGPISTALRNEASNAGWDWHPVDAFGSMARHLFVISRDSDVEYSFIDHDHRSLFLLILAEALADIGL
jgi:hypothetical protein